MEPTLQHLVVPGPRALHGGPRRVAWWEWNATGAPHPDHIVVCVHGLSRQARDFDVLARALAHQAAVVCVDVAGRGHSDWLEDPMAYQIPTYVNDLAVVLAHLRQRHAQATGTAEPYALRIDWVGTSMGGLIGMALAAQPAIGLRRLVLNDVGPVIEPASLERIAQYLGSQPVFPSEQAAADALWQVSQTFGPHTPEQWLALTRPMLRPVEGGWTLHYDPRIAVPFRAMLEAQRAAQATDAAAAAQARAVAQQASAAGLWALYDAITCPTLLLRGAASDLLSRATALAMTQRGPRARLVEFPGVGHAPTLVQDDQVRVVRDFLLAP
ncbi:2-succinyl-6-hydroxy-2,4-cyclohexadiene-1-carboxylate synthase [Tepidimonas thermarum]|uniref:2-succinyl-6-hydroxy-2, 4-cyclohexadiene-1-carboxylate synthase n=2 Tax=Tepidimonas TaxID=114248 RepID=A0A554X7N7_9BURK|nr:alpha/beta hydrolase [Tepidimonas thermarum]TSE31848.1 2-succinyl-6-hydroxy-2,4-cyclohexadiene-1-carboxylate synthase [Tepidimonas thermarum]